LVLAAAANGRQALPPPVDIAAHHADVVERALSERIQVLGRRTACRPNDAPPRGSVPSTWRAAVIPAMTADVGAG
jgi:hypothetical protein